jgi:cytochrome c553
MKMMTLMVLMMPVLMSAPALAAEPVSAGERLAATCTACHGTNAALRTGTALPPLAGQPKETLLASLKAFKDGSRPATIMTQLAKGYSDEQLEQIAAWFAVQKGDRP